MPFDGSKIDELGKILLDAADVIEQQGWCQGRIKAHDGRVCALGAVASTLTDGKPHRVNDVRFARAGVRLSRTIYGKIPEDDFDAAFLVARWNDDRLRTKEQVVAMMRRAAFMENEDAI